jgi:hypothetical protein
MIRRLGPILISIRKQPTLIQNYSIISPEIPMLRLRRMHPTHLSSLDYLHRLSRLATYLLPFSLSESRGSPCRLL